MTFLESNSVIDITNALPKSDNDGKTQTDLFEFAVTTTSGSTKKIGYDISIEPIIVETGYTGLNPEDIKVYLTDKEGNVLVKPTKLSNLTNFKLYSNVHDHIAEDTRLTSKYVLRAWIDGGVRATDWYKEYKDSNIQYQYKFRVNVNGEETFLTGLTKTIADNSVLDNVSSKYVSSSTGINFAEAPSDTNGKGIYQRAGTGTNGEYPIYYYRGEVDNNNVAFNNFCWKIVRTTETGGIKLIYNGTYDGDCNNTGDASTIGDSSFNYFVSDTPAPSSNNENSDVSVTTLEKQGEDENVKSKQIGSFAETTPSPADVGYMYGTRYTKYSVNMSGNTNTIVYGNDVTYSNGTYTLKDTITSTSYDADYKTIGKNHHYTCFNSSNTCSEVYYIYFSESGYVYSLLLTGGVNIDEALNEMLTNSSNTNDSTIKSYIDNWYSENMNSKTSLLEDTIWCNDRSIYNIGGFNKDTNADVTNPTDEEYNNHLLSFKIEEIIDWYDSGKAINPSIKCTSKNDSFTVGTKGNGKLTYPVGLLTGEEATLAGHGYPGYSESSYLTTGSWYWLSSPDIFYDFFGAYVSGVEHDGSLFGSFVGEVGGVRPSISLKLGTTPSRGDGTLNNPYLIETEYKEPSEPSEPVGPPA